MSAATTDLNKHAYELMEQIEKVKLKISNREYKDMMESLAKLRNCAPLYEIDFVIPYQLDVCLDEEDDDEGIQSLVVQNFILDLRHMDTETHELSVDAEASLFAALESGERGYISRPTWVYPRLREAYDNIENQQFGKSIVIIKARKVV
jgi:hypothetical protein